MNYRNDIADPLLYRVYWSIMLNSILEKLPETDITMENKVILHNFHKRILKYKSIAGISHEQLSQFLFEVGVFWAERGIFVKTSRKQLKFKDIEKLPLNLIWKYL